MPVRRLLIVTLCSVFMVFVSAMAHAACVSQQSGELTTVLSWTNADTVTTDSVNILRSNSTGTETLLINIPYASTYTDTVPVPTAQISYFYEVQAKGPGGISTASAEACKTFFTGPPAPTGLTAK